MNYTYYSVPKLLSKPIGVSEKKGLLPPAAASRDERGKVWCKQEKTVRPRKLQKREIQDLEGRIYKLAKPVSQGGEAIVWRITDEPLICAKIYKKSIRRDGFRKLECLIKAMTELSHSDPETFSHLAAPKTIVFDDKRHPIGYIMRYVTNSTELSAYLCSDILFCESYTRKMQTDIAFGIAHVLTRLHDKGFMAGDLSPQNILVDDRGFVTFIDVNAFKFRYKDETFECDGVHIQFTPPEHIGSKRFPVSKQTDVWAFQLILFEILLPGYEAYNYKGNLSWEEDVRNGNYYWYRPQRVIDEAGAMLLNGLSERIQLAFYNAFSSRGSAFTEDKRMTAQEWENHIGSLYNGV